MPNADDHGLGPGFGRRLKIALDRVTPPSSAPRYLSVAARAARPWRLAPIALAVATMCLLALTATAATGSPSPVVWTEHAASSLQSLGHNSEASPGPETRTPPKAGSKSAAPGGESPQPERSGTAPTPSHDADHEGSPRPEPSQSPDHSSSTEPYDTGDRSVSYSNTSRGSWSDSGRSQIAARTSES